MYKRIAEFTTDSRKNIDEGIYEKITLKIFCRF